MSTQASAPLGLTKPRAAQGRRPDLGSALRRMGLLRRGERLAVREMSAGVSSRVFRVTTPRGDLCLKQALPRLRVAQLWCAPTERNRYEFEWLRLAGRLVPGSVPRALAYDEPARLFAMEYFASPPHTTWKQELRSGRVDENVAVELAKLVAAVHNATSRDPQLASRFASDHVFEATRLEPYFAATARKHPDLAEALLDLASATSRTRVALVHGDVSPKNILVGGRTPVLLDAECAWWGDPAFDLAFCLNHLLLKTLLVPRRRRALLRCYDLLSRGYLARVAFEPAAAFERRASRLLPALLLARVDGKCPVEYLDERAREAVRRGARRLMRSAPDTLSGIREGWLDLLEGEQRR